MKKLVLLVLCTVMLCGCVSYSDGYTQRVDGISDRFQNIEEQRFLFYDKGTKIIYYFMNAYSSNGGCYSMPYISENGHFCKYVDGEIVEIYD